MSLEIEQVSVTLANKTILSEIDLDIQDGELVTLLGQSGSGKTTLIKTIAGLIPTFHGRMTLDGTVINDLPPQQRRIALVFQDLRLFPHLNVAENLAFPLRMRQLPKSEWQPLIHSLLQDVKLAGFEARTIASLSGGQQQRVAIARALAMAPQLLLLDEPFSGLDAALRQEMQAFIQRIQQQYHLKTLLITHDANEAVTMSSRIALLHQQRIQQFDSPQVLQTQPKNRIVNERFAKGNVVMGQVENQVFTSALFHCPIARPLAGPCVAILSPNRLRLSAPAVSDAGTWTITKLQPYLEYVTCTLTHAQGTVWTVRLSHQEVERQHYVVGQTVGLTFAARDLWVMPASQYKEGDDESYSGL